MSKSLGIGVEPEEVITKYGADVLRLWVSSVDFVEDVRLSDTILKRLSEAYVKFRNNIFRNALGNLYDFDPDADAVPGDKLREIDHWILLKTEELVAKCRAWYDEFAFHKVYRAVYDFATTDLSAVWVDIVERPPLHRRRRSHSRRSAQTAIYRIAYALVRLLAPLLVFHHRRSLGLSVQTGRQSRQRPPGAASRARRTDPRHHRSRARAPGNWDTLMLVRDQVLKALEARSSRKSASANRSKRSRIDGRFRSVSAAHAIRRRSARAVHRLAGGTVARAAITASRLKSSAPTAPSASAAGNTRWMSEAIPNSRRSARPAATPSSQCMRQRLFPFLIAAVIVVLDRVTKASIKTHLSAYDIDHRHSRACSTSSTPRTRASRSACWPMPPAPGATFC